MNMRRLLAPVPPAAARMLVLLAVGALALSACGDEVSGAGTDTTGTSTTTVVATTQVPETTTTDATEPPAEEQATAVPLPAQHQMAQAGRYATGQMGVTMEFTTPRELFVTLNGPGEIGMVDGFDLATGEYSTENGIALGIRRWAGWSSAEDATAEVPTASLDPYDVDTWFASTEVMVLSDETRTIADRPVRVFDVTVDPETDLVSDVPGEGVCFEGFEPCIYIGSSTSSPDSVNDWLSAIRTTRFYLFTIEGSQPLLIRASAPHGHPWIDEVESSVIPSLVLGPDAPPLP